MERAAVLRSSPQFDDGVEQPGVESLGASALANLVYPPDSEEGSTAVAKEILSAGAVITLLGILPSNTKAGSTPHAQQWAAAGLCNMSMHGRRARQMMVEAGVFSALSAAITWLSCGQNEGVRGGAQEAEARAVATQLLLGCLTNVIAFHEDPTQLFYPGGAGGTGEGDKGEGDDKEAEGAVVLAVESALAVLETATARTASAMVAQGDGDRDSDSSCENPVHAAATTLLLQVAESFAGTQQSDADSGKDTEGAQLLSQLPHRLSEIAARASETEPTGGMIWNAATNCAEILCVELGLPARIPPMLDEGDEGNEVGAETAFDYNKGISTAAVEEEAKAAVRIQARQRGRIARKRHAAGREAKRTATETDDCEDVGKAELSEEDLLKIELMLEKRHETEDQRLQQLMIAFKRHDSGSGKVPKDDLVVRASTQPINTCPAIQTSHDIAVLRYPGDARRGWSELATLCSHSVCR